MNLLFICSKNQWRSPTAEQIWRRIEGVSARSAGTARSARRQVRLDDIRWADLIFAMEDKHAARLRADFRQELAHTPVHVLDIPDDYPFMDPELIELLRAKVEPLLSD